MTVGSQVKQCYYGILGAEENLKDLAEKSTHQVAVNDLLESTELLKEISLDLKKRIGELELEEPQFKGF